MSREIKFRAWEKQLKEMIPVWNINFDKRLINTDGDQPWRLFDEIELMQYTGLHDRNGKEIYEGDVVKVKDSRVNWRVGFKPARFTLEVEGISCTLDDDPILGALEVIGNIYENPELLEQQNA